MACIKADLMSDLIIGFDSNNEQEAWGEIFNFETTDLKHENEQHKFKPSTLNIKTNDFPSIIKPLNKTD